MNKGLQAIYDQSEPSPLDPVGFGLHAAKTYEEIFLEEKSYMAWVLKTAQEDPQGCAPRLLRLAGWLHKQAQQNMNHTAQAATSGTKMPMGPMGTMIEAGKTSAGTGPQPSGSNDQMLTMMQQLMSHVQQLGEEVQNIKEERPHKKEGRAVSEATSGSFDLMQPWMSLFQLWQNSPVAVCQVPRRKQGLMFPRNVCLVVWVGFWIASLRDCFRIPFKACPDLPKDPSCRKGLFFKSLFFIKTRVFFW